MKERREGEGMDGGKRMRVINATLSSKHDSEHAYVEVLLRLFSSVRICCRKYRTSWNVGSRAGCREDQG